jgi:acyl dehydratase
LSTPDSELIGRRWPPLDYEVGREKIREYAAAVGETSPIYYQPSEAAAAGFRALVAPPMFCSVYIAPAMARAAFHPDLGVDRARLVHGEQCFEWLEPVCAGDTIATACELTDLYTQGANTFYVFASTSRNQDGAVTTTGAYTAIVRGPGGSSETPRRGGNRTAPRAVAEEGGGVSFPEFRVTPDRYLPFRYAGASGDFTPIHLDAEFARSVGLPGIILHGLYTMAVVARAQVEAAGGDPRTLRRLRVRFRGVALPEVEISVTGRVREAADGTTIVDVRAVQGDTEIVGNAEAVLSGPVS